MAGSRWPGRRSVTVHSTLFGADRLEPLDDLQLLGWRSGTRRALKFVVSTTSVSPSQRPRATPMYGRCSCAGARAAVERDDARLVDHLVADGDDARRLVISYELP